MIRRKFLILGYKVAMIENFGQVGEKRFDF
jgi:hypothetical protein